MSPQPHIVSSSSGPVTVDKVGEDFVRLAGAETGEGEVPSLARDLYIDRYWWEQYGSPGEGTTLFVTLSLEDPDGSAEASPEPEPEAAPEA